MRKEDINNLQIRRGILIREARNRMGLSQTDLANLLSVSVTTIGMVETGRRAIKNNRIKEWCDTLNIDYHTYISGKETVLNQDTKNIIDTVIATNPYEILKGMKINDERFVGEYRTYLCLLEKQFMKLGYKIVLMKEDGTNG